MFELRGVQHANFVNSITMFGFGLICFSPSVFFTAQYNYVMTKMWWKLLYATGNEKRQSRKKCAMQWAWRSKPKTVTEPLSAPDARRHMAYFVGIKYHLFRLQVHKCQEQILWRKNFLNHFPNNEPQSRIGAPQNCIYIVQTFSQAIYYWGS